MILHNFSTGIHSSPCLHQPERKGKYAAIKRAMQNVQTPVVIFSDANTMLNKECIKNIVPHYNDEKVGGVAGEKKIISNKKISAARRSRRNVLEV